MEDAVLDLAFELFDSFVKVAVNGEELLLVHEAILAYDDGYSIRVFDVVENPIKLGVRQLVLVTHLLQVVRLDEVKRLSNFTQILGGSEIRLHKIIKSDILKVLDRVPLAALFHA